MTLHLISQPLRAVPSHARKCCDEVDGDSKCLGLTFQDELTGLPPHALLCAHQISPVILSPSCRALWARTIMMGRMFGTATQDESYLWRTCQQRSRTYFSFVGTGSSHTKAFAITSVFCFSPPNFYQTPPFPLIPFITLQTKFMIRLAGAELFYLCLLVYRPAASFTTLPLL